MKRDMDLVRQLLIDFSNGKSKEDFVSDVEEDEKIMYHMKIMKDAGLIDYKEAGYYGGMSLLYPPTLTWQGNDYLDAISNDSVWNKTKDGLKEKGLELSNVPFSVLKDYAVMQFKYFLGIE